MACSRSIFATSNVGKTGTPGRDWPRRLSDPRVNHDIGLSQSFAVSTKRGTQSSFSAMTGCSKYGSSYLSAFDAVRTSILEIAREAYSHGRRNYYTLTATDFHGFTFTPSSAGMRK
jgi:hypothetical protein